MKLKAGKQVVEALVMAYRANTPVLVVGRHGIGKSQLLEQAAKALGVDCIVRDLSLMEPPDLVGLPYQKDGRTVYAPPSFLPTGGRGLFVLEEVNRAEKFMLAPCLQLLTARCLNDYRLPDGWLPVAAINPAADAYDVGDLDPALLSRFTKIEVEACPKTFVEWAEGNGVHQAVRHYVASVKDIFACDESNPRAWTYLSNLLKAFEQNTGSCTEGVLLAMMGGQVGDTLARAFLQSYHGTEEPLTLKGVLDDQQKAICIVRKWMDAKRTDLLAATAHQIKVALQSSDQCTELHDEPAKARLLRDFCRELPADLSRQIRTFMKQQGVLE
jgi:hypothetical protein